MAFVLPAASLRATAAAGSSRLAAVAAAAATTTPLPARPFSSSSLARQPVGSGSTTASRPARSQPAASSGPSTSAAAGAASSPRKELFAVYTPSSRAEHTQNQRASTPAAAAAASGAASGGSLRGRGVGRSAASGVSPGGASSANASAEEGDDAAADGEEDGEGVGSSSPSPGSASSFTAPPTGPKANRRFLHGQLIAPSAFAPLANLRPSAGSAADASAAATASDSPPSSPAAAPLRPRARPLLGPSAALAKRLDPFHKLGLNPSKPSLHDDSYKNGSLLAPFVSELGRILPRSRTGLTRKSQRQVGKAVRRARSMGLLPVFSRGTGRSGGYVWR